MQYNIHPLFVHFPIALLFVYSIIRILPLIKWFPTVAWKHIERALLFFGILGAFAALSTGEIAEHLARPNHQLVEMHSLFASVATCIYGLLLAGEILLIATPRIANKIKSPDLIKYLSFITKILTNRMVSVVLAIVGLITISLTGLLGGVIVYGTTADPLASIVLQILGISL